MGQDDFALLDRWRQGDRTAGNQLFQRHFSAVVRFFQNKLHKDVDELVQMTFLACVRGRDQFRKQSSFRSFLFTIARNQLYSHLKRRKREGEKLDFGVTSLADIEPTPRSKLARRGQRVVLLHALRSLSIEDQVMIELYYWDELSLTELGEVLGVPASTAGSRLFRARKRLQQLIQELDGDPTVKNQSLDDLDAWARSVRGKALADDSA